MYFNICFEFIVYKFNCFLSRFKATVSTCNCSALHCRNFIFYISFFFLIR
nr:MAG TPA: hypothetical protein [Caudoviricetes sp.]